MTGSTVAGLATSTGFVIPAVVLVALGGQHAATAIAINTDETEVRFMAGAYTIRGRVARAQCRYGNSRSLIVILVPCPPLKRLMPICKIRSALGSAISCAGNCCVVVAVYNVMVVDN